MKYTVTIAMPIYNVAPYVEKSLLSALNQTLLILSICWLMTKVQMKYGYCPSDNIHASTWKECENY